MEKNSIVEEKNNHPSGVVTPVSRSAASLVKIDSISIDLGKVMDKKVTERCHHFSIRRYVAEMREKDIKKCAPFVRDGDDETKLREQLFPLHVPEFRWWRCESCVQNISVASASESQNIVEKASASLIRDEVHPSVCINKDKDDASVGLMAVSGQGNSVKDVSSLPIGEHTSSLVTCPPCQIPERNTDGTVGEELTGKELTDVCVPEPGGDLVTSDVLAIDYPNQKSSSSGDMCPAEKTDSLSNDKGTLVVPNEATYKDVDMDISKSAKEAGPVEQPSIELQTKQVESTAIASCPRRRKKVRLIAELLNANGEERSDQRVSNNAIPKKVSPLASTSGQRKRKITQEPSRGTKPPSREPKKARKYKGDAKTTIATIHISDSNSEEDGVTAGSGYRSHMPLQQAENMPSSSKLNSSKSMPRGSVKDDIGLELSLNSYMDVDKIDTPVQQKKTVLNTDLRTEGNCIGQLSAPNISLSEDVVDISGKNAYSSDMMHEGENSPSLHKKLDLSLGCNIKKTNVPERFSEVSQKKTTQGSKTACDQRSNDEIPMDIVELMAKHQYERGLSEIERNSFLAKRISESNNEVMGFSEGHGNEVRSMQKEQNRWNPSLSQNNNNPFVAGNRDGSHVLTKFGTHNSASRTVISNDTQNRLWNGDNWVHRSSQTDPQVFDTYNKAHDGPQPSGMTGKNWACGASSLALKPNFPERVASQTSYLPTIPFLDTHKGKTIRDFDLNCADPNDSDDGVLLPCPFVANNTVSDSNRKEMESSRSCSNAAMPAIQLLSLMDAGTQSRAPSSADGKKVTDKPLFPFNNHRDFSMDQRANLFEKPLFPQHQELKEYSGSETAAYKSSPSTRPISSALIDKTCNPYKDKQLGILGVSAEVPFPVQRNALNIAENQKNVSACHMQGPIRPLEDISNEEVCIVSRNPADFSVPEPGNIYMIGSGDLKFSKGFPCRYRGFDGQRRH